MHADNDTTALTMDPRLAAAIAALSACGEAIDDFELARAQEMILGYHARWCDEPYETIGVEVQALAPIINPATGHPSRTYQQGGKMDVIVRNRRDGFIYKVEHKTSGENIGPGERYWARLRMDTQVSTYYDLAQELGYDVRGCLYDVLKKPALRPFKATPEEHRKYVKKTGALYENQHAFDETVGEYALRVHDDIADNIDKYFAREIVVRLEADQIEAAYDRWQTAELIREARTADRHPRNPDACERIGRGLCTFFDVCTGVASLDDATRFRQVTQVHEELDLDPSRLRLRVLTNSEQRTFRRCAREHNLAYELGYRAVEYQEALRFGTLVHAGLAGWWLASAPAQSVSRPEDRIAI